MRRPQELSCFSSNLSSHGIKDHENNNSNINNNHNVTSNNDNLVDGLPDEDRAALFPIIKLAFPSMRCSKMESSNKSKNKTNYTNNNNSNNNTTAINNISNSNNAEGAWYAKSEGLNEVVGKEEDKPPNPRDNGNGINRETIHDDVDDHIFSVPSTMSMSMYGSRHGHTSLQYNFIISTPPPWNESSEKSEMIKGNCGDHSLSEGGIFLQESGHNFNLLMQESTKSENDAPSNVTDDKLSLSLASVPDDIDGDSTQVSCSTKKGDATPLQCRRSNGKQWQCSRTATPGMVYCDLHQNYKRTLKPIKESGKKSSLSPNKQDVNGTRDRKNVSENSDGPMNVSETQGIIDSKNHVLEKGGSIKKRELDRSRCHRSDGKLWQCSKLALPNSIYCEHHHKKRKKKTKKDSISASIRKLSNNGESEDDVNNQATMHSDQNLHNLNEINPGSVLLQDDTRDARKGKLYEQGFDGKQHGHGCVEQCEKNGIKDGGSSKEASLSGSNPIVWNSESIGTMLSPCQSMERCHRKDGKKWQCSKYCKPGFSYCEHHQGRLRKSKALLTGDKAGHSRGICLPEPNVKHANTTRNTNTNTKASGQCESKESKGRRSSDEHQHGKHRGNDQTRCISLRKCEEKMRDCSVAVQQCTEAIESSTDTMKQTHSESTMRHPVGTMHCPNIQNGDISNSVESLFLCRNKDPLAMYGMHIPLSIVYPPASAVSMVGDAGKGEIFNSYKALLGNDAFAGTTVHSMIQHQGEASLLVSSSSSSSASIGSSACPYDIQMQGMYAAYPRHQQSVGPSHSSQQNVSNYCIIESEALACPLVYPAKHVSVDVENGPLQKDRPWFH